MTSPEDKSVEETVGMGGNRVGFGERPAVVVIDLQTGLTRSEYSLGADLSETIRETNRLTSAAADADVPVIYTRHVPNPDGREVGIWAKIEDLEILDPALESGRLDDRLEMPESSTVVDKSQASAFHETKLDSMLTGMGIDTVIVAGCSTSGCIRATSLDACSHPRRGGRPWRPRPVHPGDESRRLFTRISDYRACCVRR
jgi:nicotinamidase-related amidase